MTKDNVFDLVRRRSDGEIFIRQGDRAQDGAEIWRIFAPILAAGETYDLPRDWDQAALTDFWFASENTVAVAAPRSEYIVGWRGQIAGSYFLRANGLGGGAHVATAGFIVDPEARRRGLGAALCANAEETARAAGFKAMQFNHVVASNADAIRLWTTMGYAVIGRAPNAFAHPTSGFVDQLIMHKEL